MRVALFDVPCADTAAGGPGRVNVVGKVPKRRMAVHERLSALHEFGTGEIYEFASQLKTSGCELFAVFE